MLPHLISSFGPVIITTATRGRCLAGNIKRLFAISDFSGEDGLDSKGCCLLWAVWRRFMLGVCFIFRSGWEICRSDMWPEHVWQQCRQLPVRLQQELGDKRLSGQLSVASCETVKSYLQCLFVIFWKMFWENLKKKMLLRLTINVFFSCLQLLFNVGSCWFLRCLTLKDLNQDQDQGLKW